MNIQSFFADADRAMDFLGDKPLTAWASAVVKTRATLALYKNTLPDLAAMHGPRGLSNMVHDFAWSHLLAEVDDMDEVVAIEDGSLREVLIRDVVRVRIKKHTGRGAVSTYPTALALQFYAQERQPHLPLEGIEQANLVFGYVWDPILGEVGEATVSYPLSARKSLWIRELPEEPPFGLVVPSRPRAPSPIIAPLEEPSKQRRE